MRDKFIKCHKNDFGQKDYNLNSDKSALSNHVNKIIKSNIGHTIPALNKPYLAKQTTVAPQESSGSSFSGIRLSNE